MIWTQILSGLSFLFPLGSLTLFLQAVTALYFPEHEIGIRFIESAGSLMMIEFIFMHSAIFIQMREYFEMQKWMKYCYTAIVVLVYLAFIWPLAEKNYLVGVNFFFCTVGRILDSGQLRAPQWMKDHFGVQDKNYPKFAWVPALLRAGSFLLLIFGVVLVLPKFEFPLDEDFVRRNVLTPNNPRDLIQLIEVFAIYYFVITASWIGSRIGRRASRPLP